MFDEWFEKRPSSSRAEFCARVGLRADRPIVLYVCSALLEGSPPIHGRQRLHDGFDIGEVVAEYHEMRGCVYELAEEHGILFSGRRLQIVNRVIDEAIGLAVQTYATERAVEIQQRRAEQLAFVAHDLRTPLSAVRLAAGDCA